MRKLVIIPAYNEEGNLEKTMNDIKENAQEFDYIIINDCSRDNTLEMCRQKGFSYLNLPVNLGIGGAVQTGYRYAYYHGYDVAVQFDGDGQHIASELAKMFELAKKEDTDIVIGSRFLVKTDYNHPFFRRVGTGVFQKIIKLVTGKTITDPTSGLQVLSKRVYSKYAKINNYPEFPDTNLIIEMLLLGYTIKEVPVKMKERIYGESMHGGIWKPITYMIGMFYSILLITLKHRDLKKMSLESRGDKNGN